MTAYDALSPEEINLLQTRYRNNWLQLVFVLGGGGAGTYFLATKEPLPAPNTPDYLFTGIFNALPLLLALGYSIHLLLGQSMRYRDMKQGQAVRHTGVITERFIKMQATVGNHTEEELRRHYFKIGATTFLVDEPNYSLFEVGNQVTIRTTPRTLKVLTIEQNPRTSSPSGAASR